MSWEQLRQEHLLGSLEIQEAQIRCQRHVCPRTKALEITTSDLISSYNWREHFHGLIDTAIGITLFVFVIRPGWMLHTCCHICQRFPAVLFLVLFTNTEDVTCLSGLSNSGFPFTFYQIEMFFINCTWMHFLIDLLYFSFYHSIPKGYDNPSAFFSKQTTWLCNFVLFLFGSMRCFPFLKHDQNISSVLCLAIVVNQFQVMPAALHHCMVFILLEHHWQHFSSCHSSNISHTIP